MMFLMPSELSFAQIRHFSRKLWPFEGIVPKSVNFTSLAEGEERAKISKELVTWQICTGALKKPNPHVSREEISWLFEQKKIWTDRGIFGRMAGQKVQRTGQRGEL